MEPPLPFDQAGSLAVELGHHLVRGGPEQEGVGVVAVGGDDPVTLAVGVEEPGRDRFLADVDVKVAADLAGAESALAGLLEEADPHHIAVVAQERLGIDAYRKGDRIITAYRDHAHVLLLGATPKDVMAELYGKGTGLVKGKGGSMHLFDVTNGLNGGYGIVGGHIPLGVGMAYAQRYSGGTASPALPRRRRDPQRRLPRGGQPLRALGPDSLNPASSSSRTTSTAWAPASSGHRDDRPRAKFESYGIEHDKVDGMDVEAVLKVANGGPEVRETGKPFAVEALTYRIVPHGAADFLEKYRTKEEVRKWRERDPIGLVEHKSLEAVGSTMHRWNRSAPRRRRSSTKPSTSPRKARNRTSRR